MIIKMYALIDIYRDGSVKLYKTLAEAKDSLKSDFKKAEQELTEEGRTFGKSNCYYLEEEYGMCFGDGCLSGHWWTILEVNIHENWLDKSNLFAVVKMMNEHTITVCDSREMAEVVLRTNFENKKKEILDSGMELDERTTEILNNYANVSPKCSFAYNAWTIFDTTFGN